MPTPPQHPENWWSTLRLAVTLVGSITILATLSVAWLTFAEREVPEGLVAIGAGGVGALATLLTTGRTGPEA